MENAVEPLLLSVQTRMEEIVHKIHSEDFSRYEHMCFNVGSKCSLLQQNEEISSILLIIVCLIAFLSMKDAYRLIFCCSAQLSVNISDTPEAPCSSYINELQVWDKCVRHISRFKLGTDEKYSCNI